MEFAVTPKGEFGLVTKKYPDGTLKLNLWDKEESYYGPAEIQPDNTVHPDKDKFINVVENLKMIGLHCSFF